MTTRLNRKSLFFMRKGGFKTRPYIMFLIFCLFFFFISSFAQNQSDLERLHSLMLHDSIVRADFIHTRQVAALPAPLVSEGRLWVVRDKGVVWFSVEPPPMFKEVILFNDDNLSRPQQAMLAPLFTGDFSTLQRRFDIELSESQNGWRLVLNPRSAVIRSRLRQIIIAGAHDYRHLDVAIISPDNSTVEITITPQRPTAQFLTSEEEALFETP